MIRTPRGEKPKELAVKVIGEGSKDLSKDKLQEYIKEEQSIADLMTDFKSTFVVC